jgi:hypothetical protein
MCEEDGQVNWSKPIVGKTSWATMKHDGEVSMIGEVTNQKNDRNAKGRNHAITMRDDFLPADENKSGGEEYGTEAVERGVYRGQIVNVHR